MRLDRRAFALVLTLLLAPLAGCLGGEDARAGDEDVDATAGGPSDAPQGRGPLLAIEETNATEEGAGGLDHHHDYWEGRERVLIFEQHAKMQPMKAREVVEYAAQATFRPVPGAMVYEGTQTVEFTITVPERHACVGEDTVDGDYVCTDNWFGVPRAVDPAGGPAGLTLRYKHASTSDWIDVGPIEWDVARPIAITTVQTDMPHATSSLWEFQVLSPNKHDQTLTFTAKAEILRAPGEDIPLWPGHPDFYAEGFSRVVLDRSGAIAGDPGLYGHGAAIVPAEAGPVHADRLISYGTRTLYVWLNITEVQAPNPATAPHNWFLFHTNASGMHNITDAFDVEGHPFEAREFHWVLPVEDGGMDSPYSDSSRWNFMLGGNVVLGVLACYADCANWAATYDIVVHATNEALEPEAYDWYCLRDEDCAGAPAA